MTEPIPRATADDPVVGFSAQALRYFRREHEAILREPLQTRAAWKGRDLVGSQDWIVSLAEEQIRELETASRTARAGGAPLAALTRERFPLATLGDRAREWAAELREGRGFVMLRGLPVERWGEELSSWAFWGLGQHLGEPGAQNPAGDLLGHVVDTGEDASDPYVRRYRTSGEIAYHCDLADVVGLLCLRTARSGGASRIASSVSVYNALLERRPDWIERLYEPFLLDARGEQGADGPAWIPVPPCRYAKGHLRTFFHSDYFRSVARHEGLDRPTGEELEVLDLYEELASSPELRLDVQLQPGDVQWLSNHVVLHGRTAYEDDGGSGRERHLLRLWLSLRASGSSEASGA